MEETSMSPGLEVERIVHHLQRPGFRVSELQIGPAQQVPWHSHTNIGDTFYVLAGRIRVWLRNPDKRIELGPGQFWGPATPGGPHRVTNTGGDSATFLVLHGIGDYDYGLPSDPHATPAAGRWRAQVQGPATGPATTGRGPPGRPALRTWPTRRRSRAPCPARWRLTLMPKSDYAGYFNRIREIERLVIPAEISTGWNGTASQASRWTCCFI